MALHRFECAVCGKKATKKSKKAIYCSPACSQRAYEKRKGIKPPAFIDKKVSVNRSVAPAKKFNVLQNWVKNEMVILNPEVQKLTKKKTKLISKLNRLSTKDENIQKWISLSVTAFLVHKGYKNLGENPDFLEVGIKIFGTPLLFRYLTKNVLNEIYAKDAGLSDKLNLLRLEIDRINERLTEIEIQETMQKAALKFTASVNNPQIERTDSYTAISADEMKKIKRTVYKLKDKWKYFLGEIEQNFKAIIHGKPKQGKSHFAIQFAQYLHSNFGDVVYFAAEEGASITMENKLTRWNAKFKIVYNILGTKGIEDYIKKYQPKFVFIDSISRLQLSADNINFLVDEYIDTAWILVTQSTKHNSHKGSQELTHLADSIIQVVEGVAQQKGRTVNGETELEVFGDNGNTSK